MQDAIPVAEFLEIAVAAASCPSIGNRNICIFCVDSLSPVCEMLSNLADSCAGRSVPLICDTEVPGWIDDDTEVIVVSTDGNGKIMENLAEKGCRIHVITANSKLIEFDDRVTGYAVLLEESGSQGRMAETLGALCGLLNDVKGLNPVERLTKACNNIDAESISRDAEAISAGLSRRRMAVYSPTYTHASASAWKHAIIEATGLPAFSGELPEFDHNELVGWSDANEHAPELLMVVLKGDNDDSVPSTIVNLMSEVLKENKREVLTVPIGGGDSLEQNLRGVLLGLAVSKNLGGIV